MHWADDATLDALRYLIRRIADLPAVLVLTYRDDEAEPRARAVRPARPGVPQRPGAASAAAPAVAGRGAAAQRGQPGRRGRAVRAHLGESVLRARAAGLGAGRAGSAHDRRRRAGPGPAAGPARPRTCSSSWPWCPSALERWLAGRAGARPAGSRGRGAGGGRGTRPAHRVRPQDLVPARADPAGHRGRGAGGPADGAEPAGAGRPDRADRSRRVADRPSRRASRRPGRHRRTTGRRLRGTRPAPARTARPSPTSVWSSSTRTGSPRRSGPRCWRSTRSSATRSARRTQAVGAQRQAVDAEPLAGRSAARSAPACAGCPGCTGGPGTAGSAEQAGREASRCWSGPGTPGLLALALSNQSQLCMLAHRPAEAIDYGERAVALAREVGDAAITSHALTNIGTAQWYLGRPGRAAPCWTRPSGSRWRPATSRTPAAPTSTWSGSCWTGSGWTRPSAT